MVISSCHRFTPESFALVNRVASYSATSSWHGSLTPGQYSTLHTRMLSAPGPRKLEDFFRISLGFFRKTRYSITLSACDSSAAGMVRPSDLAVRRLMTTSICSVTSIGRFSGLAPCTMSPSTRAACQTAHSATIYHLTSAQNPYYNYNAKSVRTDRALCA